MITAALIWTVLKTFLLMAVVVYVMFWFVYEMTKPTDFHGSVFDEPERQARMPFRPRALEVERERVEAA